MARNIVLGNWKMNLNWVEAKNLLQQIQHQQKELKPNVQIGVATPSVFIQLAAEELATVPVWKGSQNIYNQAKGAFTGEISAEMVHSIGADFTLIGHSERRAYFNESNEELGAKVKLALENDLTVVFCCGETLEERKSGKFFEVIASQLKESLWDLNTTNFKNIVLAYEPVWAIGTGETASPEQAQEVHQFIRSLLVEKMGETAACEVSILYGGSCKPDNSQELFSMPDIDGGLIGGASLNAKDFLAIANSFSS